MRRKTCTFDIILYLVLIIGDNLKSDLLSLDTSFSFDLLLFDFGCSFSDAFGSGVVSALASPIVALS